MIIYISGPMTGIAELNKRAFYSAEKRLQKLGHKTLNPHEIGKDVDFFSGFKEPTYDNYLRADMHAILDADAIYLLSGYESSWGASCEVRLGIDLKMPFYNKTSRGKLIMCCPDASKLRKTTYE